MEQAEWRKCSACKNTISFGQKYFTCSVSTCNGQRTGYVFCSVACFERHLPGARHKDAAAIANMAPSRVMVKTAAAGGSASPTVSKKATANEVLVIASRLKDYISETSGMNTSAQVMDVLSDYLRLLADRAVDSARADGRKTVMDRDFSFLPK